MPSAPDARPAELIDLPGLYSTLFARSEEQVAVSAIRGELPGLPTQEITRRETGSWKWGALQLAYMTALAYTAALITYQVGTALG